MRFREGGLRPLFLFDCFDFEVDGPELVYQAPGDFSELGSLFLASFVAGDHELDCFHYVVPFVFGDVDLHCVCPFA